MGQAVIPKTPRMLSEPVTSTLRRVKGLVSRECPLWFQEQMREDPQESIKTSLKSFDMEEGEGESGIEQNWF